MRLSVPHLPQRREMTSFNPEAVERRGVMIALEPAAPEDGGKASGEAGLLKLSQKQMKADCADMMERYDVRPRNPALRSQREAAVAAYYNRSTALSDTLKAYCPNCSRSKEDLVDHARYFRGEAGKMGAKALANATAYVQCLSNPSCPERVLTA